MIHRNIRREQITVAGALGAAKGSLTDRNFNEVAAEAATVLFSLPGFQLH